MLAASLDDYFVKAHELELVLASFLSAVLHAENQLSDPDQFLVSTIDWERILRHTFETQSDPNADKIVAAASNDHPPVKILDDEFPTGYRALRYLANHVLDAYAEHIYSLDEPHIEPWVRARGCKRLIAALQEVGVTTLKALSFRVQQDQVAVSIFTRAAADSVIAQMSSEKLPSATTPRQLGDQLRLIAQEWRDGIGRVRPHKLPSGPVYQRGVGCRGIQPTGVGIISTGNKRASRFRSNCR